MILVSFLFLYTMNIDGITNIELSVRCNAGAYADIEIAKSDIRCTAYYSYGSEDFREDGQVKISDKEYQTLINSLNNILKEIRKDNSSQLSTHKLIITTSESNRIIFDNNIAKDQLGKIVEALSDTSPDLYALSSLIHII